MTRLAALLLTAAPLIWFTPAQALDLPLRKAGLWDLKLTLGGDVKSLQGMQQCIDAATDRLMNDFGGGMSRQVCSKQEVKTVGSTMVVDSVCSRSGRTVTSRGVISGDFNRAYTVAVTSQTSGGPRAGTTTMTIAATWLGPCKSGQRPGDVVLPNGMKMNIVDMREMMKNIPAGLARPPGPPR